jgi:hypothetical protein
MKKNASLENPKQTEGKGVFYQAGEIIGSIGFHIVNGKDKLVGAVTEDFSVVKKAIKKLATRQTAEPKTKKISKKGSPRKVSRKMTGDAKPLIKKANPAKTVKKKVVKVKKQAKSTLKK